MAGELIGIGALLGRLQPDFPDISISKIRFLETEGLVTPARTASGYRKYSPEDVERLRFVLTAQRDRFWPLKVIRERLDAMERGLDVDDEGTPVAPAAPEAARADVAGRITAPARPLRLTGAELQEAADIDVDTFRELISYGLLPKNHEYFDGGDLEVAIAAGSLVDAGIGVRHLRPFKSAAEREVGLTEHVLGQQALRGRAAAAEGLDDDSVVEQVVTDCLELHVALVRRLLSEQD